MPSEATPLADLPHRPTLRSTVTAPFRLQTYRNLLYLVLAFPLGIVYFVFLSVGFSLGVGLLITIVGIPILLVVLAMSVGLASVERKLATLLLAVEIDPGRTPLSPDTDWTLRKRIKALVIGLSTWKAVFYLASKFVLGVVSFVLVMTLLVTSINLMIVPFVYDQPGVSVGLFLENPATLHPSLAVGWHQLVVGFETVIQITSWEVTTLPEAVAVGLFGVAVTVVALNLLNALAWLSGQYARIMLGERGRSATA